MSTNRASLGRSERIYTFLRKNARAYTIQAIAAATDEAGDARITSVTLASMAKRGYVVRAGGGKRGDTRYRAGEVMPKAMRKKVAGPRPATKPTASRAAPGTTVSLANRDRSAQIAADIAAFQARGGVIERLGPTLLFNPLRDAGNDD